MRVLYIPGRLYVFGHEHLPLIDVAYSFKTGADLVGGGTVGGLDLVADSGAYISVTGSSSQLLTATHEVTSWCTTKRVMQPNSHRAAMFALTDPGASAIAFGASCGDPAIAIECEAPVIGTTPKITSTGSATPVSGMLLGLSGQAPLSVFGCTLYTGNLSWSHAAGLG